MGEKVFFFKPETGIFSFNSYFDFPENIKPKVLENLKKLTLIEIDPEKELLEDRNSYQDAAYDFARSIDPNFKAWKERKSDYRPNQKTNGLLIKFYEMIKNKSSIQIANAVEKLSSPEAVITL